MLKLHFCDYSDEYILVRGTITIEPHEREYSNNIDKEVLFKKFALFTDCVGQIKNTQIVNAKDIDVVMAMFNLIEYGESYSKRWHYYRDEAALTDAVVEFSAANNNSALLKFKQKWQVKKLMVVQKNVEIMVPLIYFSNLCRTL